MLKDLPFIHPYIFFSHSVTIVMFGVMIIMSMCKDNHNKLHLNNTPATHCYLYCEEWRDHLTNEEEEEEDLNNTYMYEQ